MVKDQQEAEKKKVQSQDIQNEIEKQKLLIAQKREGVMEDLAQVEPAVIDAQQGRLCLSFLRKLSGLFRKSIFVWLEGYNSRNDFVHAPRNY